MSQSTASTVRAGIVMGDLNVPGETTNGPQATNMYSSMRSNSDLRITENTSTGTCTWFTNTNTVSYDPTKSPDPTLPCSLDLPEIQGEIVQYLKGRELFQTLLVCKSMHYLSIQHLWSGLDPRSPTEQIDSRVDLFRHLRGLLHLDPTEWSTVPISDKLWARFKHYSVHIKAIEVRANNYWPELFSVLKDHRLELFPRLQRLSVSCLAVRKYGPLQWMALAGPKLVSLRIHKGCQKTQAGCREALGVISRQASIQIPGLEEFSFNGKTGEGSPVTMTEMQVGWVSCAFQSWTNLRKFSWRSSTPIPGNFFHVLSTLPSLEQINVGFRQPPQREGRPGMSSFFPYPQQLELQLISVNPRAWVEELASSKLLGQIHIQSLRLSLPSLHSQTPNLVTLEIGTVNSITWLSLTPLLPCSSVKKCALYSRDQAIALSDSSLAAMASCWGELEEFFCTEIYPETHVTILALAELARSCPNLRRLHLDVNCKPGIYQGGSWEQDYQRIMNETYASGKPEELVLRAEPLEEQVELTEHGLGILGVARLIQKLWPSFDPSNLKKASYTGAVPWEDVQLAMRALSLHKAELDKKETELEELQKVQQRIQGENAYLRQQLQQRGA